MTKNYNKQYVIVIPVENRSVRGGDGTLCKFLGSRQIEATRPMHCAVEEVLLKYTAGGMQLRIIF